HLDLDMIEWLEAYLEKTSMTLLMVTHDRYFLEVVCDEIIEMENNELYRYKGNFSYYLEKKAEREAMDFANREKAQNLMRRELVWIRTQPKARTTKSKYREEQFGDLKKRATVRLENDEMHIALNPSRMGGKTVEFHKVKKAFGEKIIMDGFEYNFKRKEAMGIVGNNGSGKTTFLNMLVGQEEPDGGKIVVGDTVVFGYYTQSGMNFRDDQRVIEAVRDIADVIPLAGGQKITAAQLLERFLFPRNMHFNYISKLSGGEKKRLHLLRILMKNPNFLILDEPTNDLDIFTLSVLEEYLQDFPGVLLIVSHDRYFMDKLVEHILVFEGQGKLRDLGGNYTAYRERIQQEERDLKKAEAQKPAQSSASSQDTKTARSQNKMGFKEKFEYDQLTKEIEELEVLKAQKEEELMQPDLDHEAMTRISSELGAIISSLDEKSDRWLELAELE
ncbi:MAG: ABC-F family ATP-binding cassette domain-containing protein, partial [Flavobacteriales bacterium]|nr:ABC-F family ATP-binding cassette domain-containing protein [Flavobacteriales bacterium]